MLGLLADVLFFVVAMAFGGVDGNLGRAARSLVALVVLGNRLDGFLQRFCHHQSPLLMKMRSVTVLFQGERTACHSGSRGAAIRNPYSRCWSWIPGSSLRDAPE